MKKQTNKCLILRAIDGDTFEVRIDLGWDVSTEQHIRIKGIDCASLKDQDPAKRELAFKAKKEASTYTGITCDVTGHSRDIYGRMVCDLTIGMEDYAKKMIALGLATEFKN